MGKTTRIAARNFMSTVRSGGLAVSVLGLCILSLPALAQARLGVIVDRVPDNTANAHKLAPNTGAHIVRVVRDGPSARAGLQSGDIILRINETPIQSARDVAKIARTLSPGQIVPVEIMRYGKLMRVYVQPSL